MPLWIDPNWEYWQPDEEIAEAMGDTIVLSLFDSLGIEDRRIERNDGLIGYRYGQGNPDAFIPNRLARPRHNHTVYLERKACKNCGFTFQPARSQRVYCSRRCRTRHMGLAWQGLGNRQRRIADDNCPHCGILFRPRQSVQKFCSPQCATEAKGISLGRRGTVDHHLVQQMYLCGDPIKVIATAAGCSRATVQRIVRKLDEALRRPSGAPKRRHL